MTLGATGQSVTGGTGADTFNVTTGSGAITNLGNGSDVLTISSGATATATLGGAWIATSATSNAGTATINTNGYNVDISGAAVNSTTGWTLTNSGNATGVTLTGGAGNDTLVGGSGNDTIYGGSHIVTPATSQVTTLTFNPTGYDVGDVVSVTVNGVEYSYTVAASNTTAEQVYDALKLVSVSSVTLANSLTANGVTWAANLDGNSAVTLTSTAGTANAFTAAAAITNVAATSWTYTVAYSNPGNTFARNSTVTVNFGGTAYTGTASTYIYNGTADQYFDQAAAALATTLSAVAGIKTSTYSSSSNTFTIATTSGSAIITSTNSVSVNGTVVNTVTGTTPSTQAIPTVSTTAAVDAYTTYGVAGTDTMTGGGGADTFNVISGTATITDLGNGSDVLVVLSGATATATLGGAWTATSATSNAGTATINTNGYNVDISGAAGANGWNFNLTTSGSTNITGGANADTVNLGALTPTGTIALGAGANIVTLTGVAQNLSGATFTAVGGTDALQINAGTTSNTTLSAAEYTLFNAGGITLGSGDTFANTTITFSAAETGVTLNAAVGNWALANGTNSVTLGATGQSVTGGTGADTVNLGALTPTGAFALGTGTNIVTLTGAAEDLSGATFTAVSGTDALTINAGAASNTTLNAAEYALFNTGGITLGSGDTFANTTITFSAAETGITLNASVGNWALANGTNSVTLGATGQTVTGGTGADTITAYSTGGDAIYGAGGSDTIALGSTHVTADTVHISNVTGAVETITGFGGTSGTVLDKLTVTAAGDILAGATLHDESVLSTGNANLSALSGYVFTHADGGTAYTASSVIALFTNNTLHSGTWNISAPSSGTSVMLLTETTTGAADNVWRVSEATTGVFSAVEVSSITLVSSAHHVIFTSYS